MLEVAPSAAPGPARNDGCCICCEAPSENIEELDCGIANDDEEEDVEEEEDAAEDGGARLNDEDEGELPLRVSADPLALVPAAVLLVRGDGKGCMRGETGVPPPGSCLLRAVILAISS